ncbi:MAG: RNA methyltransferase [Clostridiales bacterium]|nr:RNA methyltransferase [Clostridiales bacterium]
MITSAANQQIRQIRALISRSKVRNEEKQFVVEGRKMVEEAPEERLVRVYCSEAFSLEEKNHDILEKYHPEIVADSVFKGMSDTQTPQGILAVVRQNSCQWSDLIREKRPVLILESIQDPGNLGTMIRTGEGAGIAGIIMNRMTVDVYNPKTIRSTMGSVYRVPFYVSDCLEQDIQRLRQEGYRIFAAHLKGRNSYAKENYKEASAFLIGNEGNGLSDEIAALADTYIRIPMEGRVESLNAAIAASLLMYEAQRQRLTGTE